MDFLVSFFCLFMTCTATPPVIVHVPTPSFTIESVPIGAVSKSVKKSKVLGVALGGAIDTVGSYARVESGVVKYVIIADKKWIDAAGGTSSGLWMEVRNDANSTKDDADIGDTYDTNLQAFIAPKPTADAILDAQTADWVIPAKIMTTEEQAFFSASTTEI